jgi:hypothetical protein
MAIAELGALYIANARRRGRERSTLVNIESCVRVHFEPFFGDRPVDTIEPADVIQLMGKLERDGKTPKTIRDILATLSALFNMEGRCWPRRLSRALQRCQRTSLLLPMLCRSADTRRSPWLAAGTTKFRRAGQRGSEGAIGAHTTKGTSEPEKCWCVSGGIRLIALLSRSFELYNESRSRHGGYVTIRVDH